MSKFLIILYDSTFFIANSCNYFAQQNMYFCLKQIQYCLNKFKYFFKIKIWLCYAKYKWRVYSSWRSYTKKLCINENSQSIGSRFLKETKFILKFQDFRIIWRFAVKKQKHINILRWFDVLESAKVKKKSLVFIRIFYILILTAQIWGCQS